MKPSPYKTTWRTHSCGELSASQVGQEVTLCGALDTKVEDRVYDVRDTYGTTRVKLPAGVYDEELQRREMKEPPIESIVKVTGTVAAREKADSKKPTGEIFVAVKAVEFVSFASTPLLFDPKDPAVPDSERVRHRYLYLRAPSVHENMRFRTQVRTELRRFLEQKQFEELEQPLLANKWTPDAKESYLAVRNRREVFALPGSRTVHGAILMAGGFDRVFEIGRRFRRIAAYGPFQQPEYDVLDATMAYVDESNLFKVVDELLAHVWEAVLGPRERFHVTELSADDAMKRYGTLAPDLRYGLEIHDVTAHASASRAHELRELRFNGGALRAVRVAGGEEKLAEKDAELLKLASPKVSLHWLSLAPEGTPRESGTAAFDEALAGAILHAVHAEKGDRVLVAMGPEHAAALVAGQVRAHVGAKLKLSERKHALVRIQRLPYFRYDAAKGELVPSGDPLAMPVEAELDGDPKQLHGTGFFLVLDGVNIGGGALRNHDLHLQNRVFEALRLSTLEIDQRFSGLLKTLRFGVPPHGRFGLGVDRLAALLKGLTSIHEMIPLPKAQDGQDPLTRSPWPIDNNVVRALFAL
jgi:aspartyl-tRNA synthetase